ncbi:Ig-like domain-containing protein [Microbacterium aurugineum]|uniref:Ig-like domain-containing protein n=1 Tax=Microbacterium aurugineum TaxID=2851642 RepID=UPI0020BE1036|nr:Ig-like domain-containing protein [Microbacterium aurugineum]MCK8477377.1 Ig-like domain-containing protein [Microbacterium aurugineum]
MTIVAAAAAVLTAAMTLAGAGAASAADYDYPAAIDPASIAITTVDGGKTVTQYEQVRVDADWAVPDGAVGGQTFGLTLPTQFARAGMTFSVPSTEDPSKIVAECVVSADRAPVVTCTLTDYVNGRTGINGSLWFSASADEQTSERTVEFVVDGRSTRVEIPGGGIGPSSPLPSEPQKWSWQANDGRIVWQLALPGASFRDADSIIVDDVLTAPNAEFAEHHNADGKLVVWSTDALDQDARTISNWTGGWNADGTAFHLEIPGPIDPARMYFVKYFTIPSSQAAGTVYGNVADVNGVALRDTQVWRVTGGGTGEGAASGGFTVTKTVEGSGAPEVPTDAVYTVRYSYGDPVVERTVEVAAGATAPRIQLPSGTVVTLVELSPPAVEGIEWGTPVFSGSGVQPLADGGAQLTVSEGATLAVTLTNAATAKPPVIPPTEPPAPTAVTPPNELPLTGQGTLATTGGDVPVGYLWSGAAAVLLGIALTVFAAARAQARRAQD